MSKDPGVERLVLGGGTSPLASLVATLAFGVLALVPLGFARVESAVLCERNVPGAPVCAIEQRFLFGQYVRRTQAGQTLATSSVTAPRSGHQTLLLKTPSGEVRAFTLAPRAIGMLERALDEYLVSAEPGSRIFSFQEQRTSLLVVGGLLALPALLGVWWLLTAPLRRVLPAMVEIDRRAGRLSLRMKAGRPKKIDIRLSCLGAVRLLTGVEALAVKYPRMSALSATGGGDAPQVRAPAGGNFAVLEFLLLDGTRHLLEGEAIGLGNLRAQLVRRVSFASPPADPRSGQEGQDGEATARRPS